MGRTNLQQGSWGHVPGGCSSQSGGDWAAHFNSGTPTSEGCGRNMYRLVCTGPSPPTTSPPTPVIYHLAPRGVCECDAGEPVDVTQCLASVQQLAQEQGETMGRTNLQQGSWGHVPGGCSSQSGGDWAAHFNSGTPTSEVCAGKMYQLVCTGP